MRQPSRPAPRRLPASLRVARRLSGWAGEILAAGWLLLHGYRILGWRRRVAGVQVDLLARQGRLLLVVEVKTRRSASLPGPEDLVSPDQRRRLERAARHLAARHEMVTRVDLVEIRWRRWPPLRWHVSA